jgi:histidinol-phosphate phosphatase family protein
MRVTVFLDRDGTINEEVGYLDDPGRLHLISGTAEAIRLLNEAGILVIVISNQAGVGRGYFSTATVEAIHQEMARQLAMNGAWVDAIYYCPHHPNEGCQCRKPEAGMLLQAVRKHGIDTRRAFMVGDKMSDLYAGRRVGCRTVLVLTGYGEQAREVFNNSIFQPDHISSNLYDAVKWILAREGVRSISETSA